MHHFYQALLVWAISSLLYHDGETIAVFTSDVVKMFRNLQDMWLSHTGWDEHISRSMLRCWREYVDALELYPCYESPRGPPCPQILQG